MVRVGAQASLEAQLQDAAEGTARSQQALEAAISGSTASNEQAAEAASKAEASVIYVM